MVDDKSSSVSEAGVVQRHYWPSIVLSCSPDHRLTPIQIQKALFLIGQNLRQVVGSRFYIFEPHNYGPFCVDIYRDLDELIDEGAAAARAVNGRDWNEFEATLPGLRIAQDILERLPTRLRDYIGAVVEWTRITPFNELLGTIYKAYPEYAVRSVFRNPQ